MKQMNRLIPIIGGCVVRKVTHHPQLSCVKCCSTRAEKKLFTPGPLGTSAIVKQAMLRDLGSRDIEFIDTVKFIRRKVVEITGLPLNEYTCVPVQGSGTFAIESVFQSTVPREGAKVLIVENGAYGKRLAQICRVLSIPIHVESFPEDCKVNPSRVEEILKADGSFTHMSIVHCETSSGVINPVDDVGKIVKNINPDISFFVDAMSSFGAVPLDMSRVDYMVSSVNKCLEGVPGFSYVVARTDKLVKCKGFSRSLCLDIVDQYEYLEKAGQFRFTPPTHTMLAFKKALEEFEKEGGLKGRSSRYIKNREVLRNGMRKMGFREFLDDSHHGYIITSYEYPSDPKFNFTDFYNRLNVKDQVIYPGKVLDSDCFRIGSIGYLFPKDMESLLISIEEVCVDMGIKLPLS